MTSSSDQTVTEWLAGYGRRDEKCKYLAGAVAALLVFGGLADKLFGTEPTLLRAFFILFTLLAGMLIGLSKIVFEQASVELTKAMNDPSNAAVTDDTKLSRSDALLKYPVSGPVFFNLALVSLGIAAILLVIAAFSGVGASKDSDACQLTWNKKENAITCVSAG